MLSFSGFRLEDGSPIYQQIIRYLEQGIAAGTIRDGDGLPSRRVPAQLGANPNTVQKACCMLEEAVSPPPLGGKSEFTPTTAVAVRTRLMEREAAALVRSLQMGLTRPEAEALIDRLWDSPELEEEKP
ncbi:MAG: GntR family transcriptional regulator [Flavonifractor plautii]